VCAREERRVHEASGLKSNKKLGAVLGRDFDFHAAEPAEESRAERTERHPRERLDLDWSSSLARSLAPLNEAKAAQSRRRWRSNFLQGEQVARHF